jgi:hypothetical protein
MLAALARATLWSQRLYSFRAFALPAPRPARACVSPQVAHTVRLIA